ncbi:2-hydroxyacid dehydrogenase [Roseomonas sp. CCTCC AB2023176]|uniref:2-hydroxyacid dehydrogenase n=1 Tax=Roseomonas sp. CCTCC AB2023176 TaxID=3342640 RepID=UPI0035DE0C0C
MTVQRIAMLQPVGEEQLGIIRSLLPDGFVVHAVAGRSQADLEAAATEADYAVWWDLPVPEAVMAAGPRLRLLHKWGVGIDNVDLEAARRRGILVARTTGSNAIPVAEFTVGALIALARRIPWAHASTANGGWEKNAVWRRSIMVSGKTVGIVGMGSIGKGVAKRLAAFDCRILYHNRSRLPAAEESALGAEYGTLDDLLRESDVVSLHCPLTPETRGMLDARAFGLMKPGALLVNVARGGVVVEDALVDALRSGHLAGAAVDVFEAEPPPPDHPLLRMDNVLVTPHIASTAYENSRRSIGHWLGNILRVSRGEPIPEADRVA